MTDTVSIDNNNLLDAIIQLHVEFLNIEKNYIDSEELEIKLSELLSLLNTVKAGARSILKTLVVAGNADSKAATSTRQIFFLDDILRTKIYLITNQLEIK